MNAIYLRAFGGVEQLVGGLQPRPVAAPGEVLVEVEASGINLADTYIRRGAFPIEESLPFIPGMEGVGRILALGEGVDGVRVGERVVFAAPGSYGAYVTIPLQGAAPWISLAPAPEGLPLAELASLGMAGRTAWGLVNGFVTGGGKPWFMPVPAGWGPSSFSFCVAAGSRWWPWRDRRTRRRR